MITKFKIFEEQQIKFESEKFSLFSRKHRYPNLPKYCSLIDIDGIYIKNGKIEYIVESKHTLDSNLRNILNSLDFQRQSLLKFCYSIHCNLLLNEISTDKWINIDNKNEVSEISKPDESYTFIDTSNKLYIEVRGERTKAVMYLDNSLFPIIKKLGTYYFRIFKVDETDKIILSEIDRKELVGGNFKIKNTFIINDPNSKEDWELAYKNAVLLH